MSLRFFTQTRTGELMSRMNNDVIGAQNAISNTFVSTISSLISLIATLAIMLTLEWRLTLLGLGILPFFILPARQIGRKLRDLRRKSMEYNAEMNSTMNETMNVSGALLVKLFGRENYESKRFSSDASQVRDIGVKSAVTMQWFMMSLSIVSAIGSAVVFWAGGHLVLRGTFTIGTIVAFGNYLTKLYGPLMELTNAPVQMAQSMVSFERVFEVLDIPVEIQEKQGAAALPPVKGHIQFENVSFAYAGLPGTEKIGLEEVVRFGWRVDPEAHLKRGKQKSNEIDFSQITDFEWDTMYVFTPYSIPKDILKKDGVTTKNNKFNIEYLKKIFKIFNDFFGFVIERSFTFINYVTKYAQNYFII